MKYTAVSGIVYLVGILLSPVASAAELELRVVGIRALEGLIHYGLYDNADDFPDGESVAGDNKPTDQETVIFHVPDLAPGEYAVAVFHDANGNGEHDVSFAGIESYGFSSDARALFSAPPFASAAFIISEPRTMITIDLKSVIPEIDVFRIDDEGN